MKKIVSREEKIRTLILASIDLTRTDYATAKRPVIETMNINKAYSNLC